MGLFQRNVYSLYHAQDEATVLPILAALRRAGLSVRDRAKAPKKGDAVLLFLSASVTAEAQETDAFLQLDGRGFETVPVNLDGCRPPQEIANALIAQHTILAERYGADELADKIKTALKKPNPLPWILIAAGAVVLLTLGGILLARTLKPAASIASEPEPTPIPTAAPADPAEFGITEADLRKIYEVVIVGDRIEFLPNDRITLPDGAAMAGCECISYNYRDENGVHWVDSETGEEYPVAHYDSLAILTMLPNLKLLTIANVDAELPDLSGLENLDYIDIHDGTITNLEGVRNTTIRAFRYTGNEVRDFTPLNDCENLQNLSLCLYDPDTETYRGLQPKGIEYLNLDGNRDGAILTLDDLKVCTELREVTIWNLAVEDLSFLQNASNLSSVELDNLRRLRSLTGLENKDALATIRVNECPMLTDISALSSCIRLRDCDLESIPITDLSGLRGATQLTTLSLWGCERLRSLDGLQDHTNLYSIMGGSLHELRDISALRGCDGLQKILLHESFELSDISVVTELMSLHDLQIYGSRLTNCLFLRDIQNKDNFSFGVAQLQNWEGLDAIQKYSYLNITNRDCSAMQYLTDATVETLEWYFRANTNDWRTEPVDWSLLPKVTGTLKLHGVPSLEGLPALDVNNVELSECPHLTSLEGLQNLNGFGDYQGHLSLYDCAKLTDWSALDGMNLTELSIEGLFTVPSFASVNARIISLTSIFDLKDLHCFDGIEPDRAYVIRLEDLDDVTDLKPLYAIRNGLKLTVPGHLGQQARELCNAGNFQMYDVTYPNGYWRPVMPTVVINSLDELQTLPEGLLKRVERLCICGDSVCGDEYWVDADRSTNPPTLSLERYGEEPIPLEQGTVLTDLELLKPLTGLKELKLYAQPLTSLEGIQYLSSLELLHVEYCYDLTDASAAFTLQNLKRLLIGSTAVESIEGVENLHRLEHLNVSGNPIADLTPIGGLSDDVEVWFNLPRMTVDDLLALPDAIASRITDLWIAGDVVYHRSEEWTREDWDGRRTTWALVRFDDNSETPITTGSLTSLDALQRFTALETLSLSLQPIETLDGIEQFPNLSQVIFEYCEALTDASALAKCQKLRDITLRDCPQIADSSFLSQIPPVPEDWGLLRIAIDRTDWIESTAGVPIGILDMYDCDMTNDDLWRIVILHKQVKELDVQWNPWLTDLSPVLSLESLQRLRVSVNMQEAIDSLGSDRGFELIIEG
ncbi:MAG: hypothetical protein IJP98_00195 [Clostridia bacterium]|nr:hypothetical protein [Clostridia bacterium]